MAVVNNACLIIHYEQESRGILSSGLKARREEESLGGPFISPEARRSFRQTSRQRKIPLFPLNSNSRAPRANETYSTSPQIPDSRPYPCPRWDSTKVFIIKITYREVIYQTQEKKVENFPRKPLGNLNTRKVLKNGWRQGARPTFLIHYCSSFLFLLTCFSARFLFIFSHSAILIKAGGEG